MKRTAVATAVAFLALLVVAAPSALAAIQTAQRTVVSAVPATDTPSVNDGIVDAIAQSASTVVIGGTFTSVSPPGSASTIAVHGLAAFKAGTGALVSGFAPTVDGTINSIIPGPAANTVYVGGKLTSIDGVHSKLALISTRTGAIVHGWKPPSMNGEVNALVLDGRHLFVGGYFTSLDGSARVGLAVLDAASGALKKYSTPDFSGHHNYGRLCDPTTTSCAHASTGIKSMDINSGRTRLVAIGNFTSVGGLPRDQVALLNLGASAATVDTSWATNAYSAECNGKSFDTYVRDVQFSPDGSYFVIAATGGGTGSKNSDGTQSSCDAAARYNTSTTGKAVRPTWIDYTGNDTFLSVALTDTAVYLGGHQRWVNNSKGNDDAREGAVPRPGIVALDPTNGMPLSWNPGRNPRGFGAAALLATSDGLYVGSDTDYIGNRQYLRKELAFFPLAGGTALPPNVTGSLPGKVFLLGGDDVATARAVSWNGRSHPGAPAELTPVDWSTARGAFEVNHEVYYGDTDGNFYRRSFDGSTFGPAVAIDPYDDPAWDSVQTGSGQTYRGVKSNFYGEMSSLTSMFYSAGRVYYTRVGEPHLYWRWFEPDSGVIGADQFKTSPSDAWSHVAGAFLSGTRLFYTNASTGVLHRVSFVNGHVRGSRKVANSSMNWSSNGAFVGSSDTTTSLAVAPAVSQRQRQRMTLKAKVRSASDTSVHPAGTVRFKDGSKTLGKAAVNTKTGAATLTTKSAPPSAPGGAVLTAYFSPSDGSSETSASAPVSYTVDPVATVPRLSGHVRVAARVRCREPAASGEAVHFSWRIGSHRVASGASYLIPKRADKKGLACSAAVSMGGGPVSRATSHRATVAARRKH